MALTFGTFILIAVVLAILMIIFWIFMIFFKAHDVIITIIDQTLGMKEITLNGKFVSIGNPKVDKIRILNKKKENIPMWRDYFTFNAKNKAKLRIFRDSNGDYHPIRTVWDDANEKFKDIVDQKNMKFWFVIETREANEKYKKQQTTLEKVLPALALIIAGFIFFFSLYYANDMGKASNNAFYSHQAEYMETMKMASNVTATASDTLKSFRPILVNFKSQTGQVNVGVVN